MVVGSAVHGQGRRGKRGSVLGPISTTIFSLPLHLLSLVVPSKYVVIFGNFLISNLAERMPHMFRDHMALAGLGYLVKCG